MAARGKHPLQAARPDIDRYRNWLAQTIGPDAKPAANGRPRYAPATVARKLSAVRALYSYLSERRVLAGSPAAGVKGPQVRREPRGRAIGDEHVRVLLAAAVEHSDQAQAIVRLLLLNGLPAVQDAARHASADTTRLYDRSHGWPSESTQPTSWYSTKSLAL